MLKKYCSRELFKQITKSEAVILRTDKSDKMKIKVGKNLQFIVSTSTEQYKYDTRYICHSKFSRGLHCSAVCKATAALLIHVMVNGLGKQQDVQVLAP